MTIQDEFLTSDFSQCFEQMRHYDDAFKSYLQFGFGGVAAVLTAGAALLGNYGFGSDVLKLVGLLLLFSTAAALTVTIGLARNRHYFSLVARYVNSIRAHYLGMQGASGFKNNVGMYQSAENPKVFNPLSGHTFQLYLLSASIAAMFGCGVACLIAASEAATTGPVYIPWIRGITAGLLFLTAQIAGVLMYWRRQDGAHPKTSPQQQTDTQKQATPGEKKVNGREKTK